MQKELKVVKRAADLTRGIFTKKTVVTLDLDDMVVYHKGLEWKVRVMDDGRYCLGDGETIFEEVPAKLALVEQGEDFATFSGVVL